MSKHFWLNGIFLEHPTANRKTDMRKARNLKMADI